MSAVTLSKTLQVALLQFHCGGDKKANLAKVTQFIERAIQHDPKPQLLVLPECFQSPYAVDQFANYAERIPEGETSTFLSEQAKKYNVSIIGGSIPEIDDNDGGIYNTSLVFNPKGEIVAKHRKVHLFDISIPGGITFKESDSLKPGNKVTVFDIPEIDTRFGLGICYDIRFPELAMIAARRGAGIMAYPGAFNTVTGPKFWSKFAVARAIDNQNYVLMCSPARNPQGGYQAYGHSMVVDPDGEILVEAGHEETIVYAELKKDVVEETRRNIPFSVQRRFDVYSDVSKDPVVSAL
ncbi:carbon-nitrogen hydrolase family protein [Lacticaseibacillus paracasei]|nr:carbon-nitrogen hydrolase family protein [Lacticaseibacillus paracasei]